MEDQELQCVDKDKNQDCEGTFIFTARDQEFYTSKGYTTPKRCAVCRKIKKLKFAEKDARPRQDNFRDDGTLNSGY